LVGVPVPDDQTGDLILLLEDVDVARAVAHLTNACPCSGSHIHNQALVRDSL
jgi:hypothetical protein